MTDNSNATTEGQPPLKPTPASAWRQAELHTLPSGNVAQLKKPDLLNLLGASDTPDLLTGIVAKYTKPGSAGQPVALEMNTETIPAIRAMANVVCRDAFVSPRIVDKPNYDAGEISIDDVSFNDRVWVLTWAFGVQGVAAQTFPERPPKNL